MDENNDKNSGESKKGSLWTTQLYCCQLRTNFDVLKPALVPDKKRKTEKFDSTLSQNQRVLRKKSNLTESPVVPKLNLKECHGVESYSFTRRQDSVVSSSDCKSSAFDLQLPQLSGRVLSDLQEVNSHAAKTLAVITDIHADLAQLGMQETMNEDERQNLEAKQEKLDDYINALQDVTENFKTALDVDSTGDKEEDILTINSSKLSPFPCDTTVDSEKDEEDDEFLSLVKSSANIETEKSQTTIAASQRVKINSQLAKEVERELERFDDFRTPSQLCSPGRTEPVPFEGPLENFLNAAPPSLKPESVIAITDRLSDTYQMQMLMANENKHLEETRYMLQEELLAKETEVERLQRKVETLQTELRLLQRENCSLRETDAPEEDIKKKGEKASSDKEMVAQRKRMDAEMSKMEGVMQKLKVELTQLQTERQQLLIARQHAKSLPPQTSNQESCGSRHTLQHFEVAAENLQAALEEVAALREQNKHLVKQTEQLAEQNRTLLVAESELKAAKSKNKQLIELSEQSECEIERLTKSKTEIEDELNDIRECLDESNAEADEYRRKYLEAQQRVEELSTEIQQRQKQLEAFKDESAAEIRLIKNQCQEKFSSVSHLPSVLNETQMKLQESQQLHAIAERSLEDMKKEMVQVMNENSVLQKTLDGERNSRLLNSTERGKLTAQIVATEDKCNELRNENNALQTRLERLEDALAQTERQMMEKTHEAAELRKLLESSRINTTRELSRAKDRSEMARRSMQVQISNLEKELAATRAAQKNAQKEKDELRQKMQMEIDELTESLEEGQSRWRGLHAHVTSLQNTLQPLKTGGLPMQVPPLYNTPFTPRSQRRI